MKIVLNRTSKDPIMKAWLANVEDRRKIFIMSGHKQTKRSRNIKFFVICHVCQHRLLPEVSRNGILAQREQDRDAVVVSFLRFSVHVHFCRLLCG
jgi:hypothetical protein